MKDCSNVLMLSRCRSSSTRWEAAEVDEMWSFVGSKSQQR
jgi:hypothetical protein